MSKQVSGIVENLPSNQQLEKGIQNVKKELRSVKHSPGIDSTGQQILTDTERVLTDTERLIQEKNEGDKVQQLLREGHKAAIELQRQADKLKSVGGHPGIDTEQLKELAEKTLETARLAGIELASSSEFRRSLVEFIEICYDIISEGTVPVAERKEKRGKGKGKGKEKLKKKVKELIEPESTKPEVGAGKTVTPTEQQTPFKPGAPMATTTTSTMAGGFQQQQQQSPEKMKLGQPKPDTFTKDIKDTTKEGGIQQQSPEKKKPEQPKPGTLKKDVKDTTKEGIEKVVNKGFEAAGSDQRLYLTEEQMDELYDRFSQLIRSVSKRERSRQVFIGILDMFKLVGQQLQPVAEEVTSKAQQSAEELRYNKHVRKTMRLAKELFEQFTGKKSLDPLLNHIYAIGKIIRKDTETGNYFNELRDFVVDLLEHPEQFDESQTRERGRKLINRARELHKKKLYTHLHAVLDEMNRIIKTIQEDPIYRNMRKDMKQLIKDIMLDESGNIVLKEHALQQLRVIIVASVIERMKIPVPVMHLEDEDMEYTLRNLVVSIRDLVPEKVILETRGRVALDFSDVREPEVEQASNVIRVVIQGVNIHMEHADIYFRHKTFPRVSDSGKLRLDIGGKGMDIVIQLQTFSKKSFFRIQFVDVDVHQLNFYLSDTRHDWLYNSVLKLLSGKLKRTIESTIENTLTNHLEYLNRLLNKQLRKAKKTLGGTSEPSSLASALKSGVTNVLGNRML